MAAVSAHSEASRTIPARRVSLRRRFSKARQKILFCACGEAVPAIAGVCLKCYRAHAHSRRYFDGNREAVLARDGGRCRGCGASRGAADGASRGAGKPDGSRLPVHHRLPGVHREELLVTLCAALRRLAKEGAASGLLSQVQAAAIASVPGARQKGRRLGAWLTLEQTQTLLVAPQGEGVRAVRDRALLGLLIGCGLRRDELAHIAVEQIQQREGRWVLVDIEGKGRRLRSVPGPMPRYVRAINT